LTDAAAAGGLPMPDTAAVAEPLLWTIAETAKALGLCQKSIWALTRAGKLPACRFGRSVRYDRRDVLAFVEASKSGGRP